MRSKYLLSIFLLVLPLSVLFAQAPVISYAGPQTYSVGTAITSLSPTNTGGAVPATTYGQVTTFAGSGFRGLSGGTGTAATFWGPLCLTTDASGNLFVYENINNVIRKITPAALVTVFSGVGASGYVDGPAGTARFDPATSGITNDAAGNLYLADPTANKIRMVTPAGVVSTFAGSGTATSVNGTGTSASFNMPMDIAADGAGNLYVAEQAGNLIRKITPLGVVTTLAGSGTKASVDGTGTSASFYSPTNIAVDNAGNVYVTEQDYLIRKITPAGVVTTLPVTGGAINFGGLKVDVSGNIYATYSNKIVMITPAGVMTTVAGNNGGSFVNGVGTAASFWAPTSVAFDGSGNLAVADYNNNLIRKISITGYTISPALPAGLNFDPTTGMISGMPTVLSSASNYTITGFNNSGSSTATLNIAVVLPAVPPTITSFTPTSAASGSTITITGTNLYGATAVSIGGINVTSFSVVSSSSITAVVAPGSATGSVSVTTAYGTASLGGFTTLSPSFVSYATPQSYQISVPITPLVPTNSGPAIPAIPYANVTTVAGSGSIGSANGAAATATFFFPNASVLDASGNIFVADQENNLIRKITPAGVVSTFAGTTTAGYVDGTGTAASFNNPTGITIDASGNLYVSDIYNNRIRKITPAGVVSTFAGSGTQSSVDGTGTAATFNNPEDIVTGPSGDMNETDVYVVRKISPAGVVTTIAGNGHSNFPPLNGTGTAAGFGITQGLAVDASGNIYVADPSNRAIRKITPAGVVTTYAGTTGGPFTFPTGVCTDAVGNVYVADISGHVIYIVTPTGAISIFAGSGAQATADGVGKAAKFNSPVRIYNDANGSLYVTANSAQDIRKIGITGYTISPALPAGLSFDPATGIISGTPTVISAMQNYTVSAFSTTTASITTVTLTVINALPPTITSFSPTSVGTGVAIIITGTGFSSATSVSIGGAPATFTVLSATSIYATVGAATSGSVSVTTPNGTATLSGFTLLPSPTIASFTPTATGRGATVTITGTGFTGATAVSFGGVAAASFTVNSATSITAVIGTGASGSVSVTSPNGTVSLSGFTLVPSPAISSFAPANAATGTSVNITGTNFTNTSSVSFGGTPAASFTVNSPTSITAVVGLGSTGIILVTTPGGTANGVGFNYISPPTITSFTPTTGITGTTVTITGTNFTGATAVSFGGTAATSFTVVSATSITAVVASGTTGNVSVTTPGGTVTLTGFNYLFNLPSTNFNLIATSAACKGSNNGFIKITAAQHLNYTATITGGGLNTPYTFTDSVTINHLVAGTYNVCFTVAGQSAYQQCYSVVITEPKDLSVYIATVDPNNKVVLTLGGGALYNVNLNGTIITTSSSQVTLNLAKGANTIIVSTDKACQGFIEKDITVSDNVLAYPNPFDNTLNLSLGKDPVKVVVVSIYGTDGKQVYTNSYTNATGAVQLDLSGLKSGLYLLKLSADNSDTLFKIIKK